MAKEGDLVKLEGGRWARLQRRAIVNAGHQDGEEEYSFLVAVELDEHHQDLLAAAEQSLEPYRRRGIPVRIRLDPEGKGKISLSFDEGEGEPAAPAPAR